MSQPLPVAGLYGLMDHATGYIGVALGKTGIPQAQVGDITTLRVNFFLTGGTEAGGANLGAIPTGQATVSHVVPVRVVQFLQKRNAQLVPVQLPCLLLAGVFY